MNELIRKTNELLKNHGFEYAFCGGWAIDLFIGAQTRKHGDIDILAYWAERDAIIQYMQSLGFLVYEMLGGGKAHHITDVRNQIKCKRNIFCCTQDCEMVVLTETDEEGIYFIDFREVGQTKLNFIEFLFNDKDETDLLYARRHAVKLALSDAILYSGGIPYLSPEMCLLYKSTDTERKGYQSDYDNAMARMNQRQRRWLSDALTIMYPEGHKWMPL
ncbi:MAG: hypothetical protein HFH14_01905 [Lachnospiraceae bacterium]|nr:hypothetical protein [Lachnospiraceae bacterium]